MDLSINRTYHMDVELNADSDEGALELAAEMGMPLLLTWNLIVSGRDNDGLPVIRFSGDRNALSTLLDSLVPHGMI